MLSIPKFWQTNEFLGHPPTPTPLKFASKTDHVSHLSTKMLASFFGGSHSVLLIVSGNEVCKMKNVFLVIPVAICPKRNRSKLDDSMCSHRRTACDVASLAGNHGIQLGRSRKGNGCYQSIREEAAASSALYRLFFF